MKHTQLKPRSEGFNLLSNADKSWLIQTLSENKKLSEVKALADARKMKTSISSLSRFFARHEKQITAARENNSAEAISTKPKQALPAVTMEYKVRRFRFDIKIPSGIPVPVDILVNGKQTLTIETKPK